MRQLYYTLRTLIRGRGSNIIKTISLTLGLFVGILLFAKIAFELNYNSDYIEPDNLCIIKSKYTITGMNLDDSPIIMGPVPKTVRESFPEEVELTSIARPPQPAVYYLGETPYTYNMMYADTLFFQTIGIVVLQGNVKDLANPDMAFISDKVAQQMFGSESPIGKVIRQDKTQDIMVKGVFRQIGENNSIRPDVVVSFENLFKYGGMYFGWGGGDSFIGFVRLREGVDVEAVNARMDAVIETYMEFNPEKNGWGVQYRLQQAKDVHLNDPTLRMKIMIMSVLGFALLLIAALNYVLISISSLTVRAKAIGVHKCNGASGGNVLSMFLWETIIIIGLSLLFVLMIILSFREFIEELLESPISGMFAWKIIWVPVLVVFVLFLVAGVLPGRVFSRIPVTQVFRHYTEGKQSWKYPLLFTQFTGVSFIFGLLCVVMMQYQQVVSYDLGYQQEGVATAYHYFANPEVGKQTIAGFPMVEDVAYSRSDIGTGLSGNGITDANGKMLFSSRFNVCDYNYAALLGIKIKEGKHMDGPNQVLVNEEYVRLMRWTDSPIGKLPQLEEGKERVVVGVMENFVDNNLFIDTQPVLFIGHDEIQGCITVRLKAPYAESLKALNLAVKEAFPANRIEFSYLPDRLKSQYESTRKFRDMVLLAFAAIVLITLMGLFGYINDEVRRRSKEIAIRKVNGAEAMDILNMLSKGMAWIAIPAVTIGTVCSYFVGKEWLVQFARFQMSLSVPLFMFIAIVILVLIFGTVILKSWHIANDDPVNSIKNE